MVRNHLQLGSFDIQKKIFKYDGFLAGQWARLRFKHDIQHLHCLHPFLCLATGFNKRSETFASQVATQSFRSTACHSQLLHSFYIKGKQQGKSGSKRSVNLIGCDTPRRHSSNHLHSLKSSCMTSNNRPTSRHRPPGFC